MTRTEIIELANVLTERKFEKFDTNSLYKFVLQDIAKRQRFWWRRLTATFSLVANTKTYDLTNVATFPTLANLAFDEISKITVIMAPSPLIKSELVPIFDPEGVIEMTLNTTLVAPSRYTMQGDHIILIDPPDLNYTAYISGWAMPNPASDSASDAVPLIPTWGHNTIVSGMTAKIFKFAYGSKNEKTLDAIAEYELGLQDLMSKKQFDPNYRSQLSLAEDAVRST
jgi:hypothetical protein